LDILRFTRPTEGEVDGNELGFLAFEEIYEITKGHGRLSKLSAEGTANCYVL
jgi:hypothetical protein